MIKIKKYEHHGKEVFVREDLKGLHREYCLCFKCKKLNMDDANKNCSIAKKVFSMCVDENLVLPVWECPEFEMQ
jgi:hypothetical protein